MSHPDHLYDEYNDFHDESDIPFIEHLLDRYEDEDFDDSYDDSMDGDAESAFGSCGWGVDEYYNSDTPMYDDYYGGE